MRQLASFLDEGFAPWRSPAAPLGFYAAWRATALGDLTPLFRDLQAWDQELESLPEDPTEAIITELKHLGLPRERWVPYLERLALELPGWSGMVLWRHRHPDYGRSRAPVSMLDYLAVPLVLERIYAQRLCREHRHYVAAAHEFPLAESDNRVSILAKGSERWPSRTW